MIIGRFLYKIYCSFTCKIEGYQDNYFFKMSVYLFNIFNKSKENDHIKTILTCLDTNLVFL